MPLTPEQNDEIERLRAETASTRRATVPALEEILYQAIPVLDHGFVRVVDYMGDDAAVVQAARVSYGRGTKKVSEDRGLINYLMRHRHTTPFEMCEIKYHVKLPIFVARQWIRHRTANVNEYSARYSILDREFYVPDEKHTRRLTKEKEKREDRASDGDSQASLFEIKDSLEQASPQSKTNRQGRAGTLSDDEALQAISVISAESARAYTSYLKLLNEDGKGKVADEAKQGLARELARVILPTNFYTQWYWKT